ncbi:MAG: SUMF1/EgtB/PvdO family nonheme iron enzyme [Alphaproteobacteria bacterium]|nr:SUMF1/EgtB/PvdO family nonheme iron enzyme [Alphaproteobacteria bacterium]
MLFFGAGCARAPDDAPHAAAASPATRACGLDAAALGSFVRIPEGAFVRGAQPVYPEEGPPTRLHIAAFDMQAHEVTNNQFAAFARATGYVTDAERSAAAGGEGVGSGVFTSTDDTHRGPGAWRLVRGATWRAPEGPGSTIDARGGEPVVHVSLQDAQAYAAWADARLPTEEEWEYAASLGLHDPGDARSGAFDARGAPIANTWQGPFPIVDQGTDGFRARAPAGCFPRDRIGLYDMIGNVWEWTNSPAGPASATIKGGSYLCADNACARFRPAARQRQDVDFSTNHIGFRVVRDVN